MNKKFLTTLTILIFSTLLISCKGVPFLPTEQDINDIKTNISSITNSSKNEKEENKQNNQNTETSDIVNIEIDGEIKESNKNNKEEDLKDNHLETNKGSQTYIVDKIITNIQEQTKYKTSLELSYSGVYNKDTNQYPIKFNNKFLVKLTKDNDLEYSLIGDGIINVEGEDFKESNIYSIERYLNSNSIVFLETNREQKDNNDYRWIEQKYDENIFPKLNINRNTLKTILTEASFLKDKNYYVFTISQPFNKLFDTLNFGGIKRIFDNSKELNESNITYNIYVNKDTYDLTKIIIRKSYNYLNVSINENAFIDLTKDKYIRTNLSNFGQPYINTTLNEFSMTINFEEESLVNNVYIDESIIYESKNNKIENKFEYKTNLTKYDFIDIYRNRLNISAIFDSSLNKKDIIRCQGYTSGIKVDVYKHTYENGIGTYMGSLELYSIDRFENKHNEKISKMNPIKINDLKIYNVNINKNNAYYIVFNEEYGLLFGEDNGTNEEFLNILLKCMMFR